MTSARELRGSYHSEMPATPSDNRSLQLWVNRPRRLKALEPSYIVHHGPFVD